MGWGDRAADTCVLYARRLRHTHATQMPHTTASHDVNGPACCNQDHGIFSPEQIVDMVARCDYVVAATPHTPGTHKLVSAAAIQAMQPHCVFINVGRGKCVDEAALTAGEVRPADAVLCFGPSHKNYQNACHNDLHLSLTLLQRCERDA